jgi:hypothetical protein
VTRARWEDTPSELESSGGDDEEEDEDEEEGEITPPPHSPPPEDLPSLDDLFNQQMGIFVGAPDRNGPERRPGHRLVLHRSLAHTGAF